MILKGDLLHGFTQDFAWVAPFAHRLEKTGFEPGRIEQILHGIRQASRRLEQLGPIGGWLLENRRDSGERCFQFVRDAIEKRFLELLRLGRELGRAIFVQGSLFVQKKGELGDESVEQFALFQRERAAQSNGEHTFSTIRRD
jgi:hypothetical protein